MNQTQTLHPVKIETVTTRQGTYTVIEVPSSSGTTTYRVDITNQRCSCPAWKFQKGGRKMCKHLKAFGFTDLVAREKNEPAVIDGVVAL